MNIKKYLSVGLIAAMTLGLTGCGSQPQPTQPKQVQQTEREKRAAEIEAETQASLARTAEENKRREEENRRKLEERLAENPELAEHRTQQEHVEQRWQQEPAPITVYTTAGEFNSRLLANLGVSEMSVPTKTVANGYERLLYPLDQSGELNMSEYLFSGTDKLKEVNIRVEKVTRANVATAAIFFNAAIQAFDPAADANEIFGALGLDETIIDNFEKPQSVIHNGKRYGKVFAKPHWILSISEQ